MNPGFEVVVFIILLLGFVGPTVIGLLFTAWYALVLTVSIIGGVLTRLLWRR